MRRTYSVLESEYLARLGRMNAEPIIIETVQLMLRSAYIQGHSDAMDHRRAGLSDMESVARVAAVADCQDTVSQ